MADDVGRLLGKLEQGFSSLVERFDRQDADTIRRDEKRDQDKKEAIAERERLHAENQRELREIRDTATMTGGRVALLEKWIDERGNPLIGRVSTLEQASVAETVRKAGQDGEARGSASVWTWIWGSLVAAAGLAGTVLTTLLGLSPETIDRIKAFFHGG